MTDDIRPTWSYRGREAEERAIAINEIMRDMGEDYIRREMYGEFIRQMDRDIQKALMPNSRQCPACKYITMHLDKYIENGGTAKQWDDPRVMIVCCRCMAALTGKKYIGVAQYRPQIETITIRLGGDI